MSPEPKSPLQDAVDIAVIRACNGRHGRSLIALADKASARREMLREITAAASESGAILLPLDGTDGKAPLVKRIASAAEQVLEQLPESGMTRRVLNGFKRAHGLTAQPVPLGETEPGIADSGMVSLDVPELLAELGKAAKANGKAIAVTIGNMDGLSLDDLGTVITGLHQAGQKSLPILLFGTGSHKMPSRAATARSYAERMFDFPTMSGPPHADQPADRPASRLSVPAPARPARPGNTGP
ncbi:MAG TPA: hypothetical protein DFI00_01360 [Rhodospirillaceae bacterium]|nr:hypothetical protein [Alphaproteobacteria bacterium]OUT40936.1 MAG: hypothetical protein CBB62_00775 [Micavibrio sp. TMED2]HCI45920.1 hypothetical protein [Rhodospirillaceae bacterium]MAS47579.1 hypothetical protein [Alphaproteobacteria bacterium]MAX96549.1 hypothetical protein [Alphaproteobacteria bacterium]|tara:strand:- start:135 stop:857 length:723 start_codon:yes stop_codon:yes gene_type:complete